MRYIMFCLCFAVGCDSIEDKGSLPADSVTDDSAGPDSHADDSGADSSPDSADDSAIIDTAPDTSTWQCGDEALIDSATLCYKHQLHLCDIGEVGKRRGDWLCWPAHAFCPEPGVYCDDTTEGWTSLPLAIPDDFLAVADGVLVDPERVFVSPIDEGFVPTRSVTVSTPTEAYYEFYYDSVVAGEEVVLKDGTYSDCYIGFEGTGEPGKPLVLRAETPGGVILDSCAIYMAGQYLVLSGFQMTGTMVYTPIAMGYTGAVCDWCAVRDVSIDSMLPESPVNRPYVQIYGRGNEVSDSTFIGKANTSAVITVDRPDPSTPLEARIYRNYFADRTNTVADAGVTNGFEVIRAGWSMDYFYPGYVVIEGNLFERCDGELETISLKASNNAVRFNTFRDNVGQISARDGFGNVVEGNYILGDGADWSGGIRVSGANTMVIGNHVQDLRSHGSRWRYPVALVTGSEDHYDGYTPVFESAVLFNRVVSPDDAFALDTGEDYPPAFFPPHDNSYLYNLLFAQGGGAPVAFTFAESASSNTIAGNAVDADQGLDGFVLSGETARLDGELYRVSAFDDEIADLAVGGLLEGPALELAEQELVLRGPELYEAVPLLEVGDVGLVAP